MAINLNKLKMNHSFKKLLCYLLLIIINLFFIGLVTLAATFWASSYSKIFSEMEDFFKRLIFAIMCALICGGINVFICFILKSSFDYYKRYIIRIFLTTIFGLLIYFFILFGIFYFYDF